LNQTSPLVPRSAHEHVIDHDNGIVIPNYIKKTQIEDISELNFELTVCKVTLCKK